MFVNDRRIINIERVKHDLEDIVGNRNITISSPAIQNMKVQLKPLNFQSLTNEILKFSKQLPHHKVAVTFKINNESTILIDVCPVTDAA